ncbi:peptide ABC transporter permease [Devosia yakushimensis]|uniref:Peptide ABC transporter permease n=1 Tax=Devosia yakushimensis TaxID=470028 RepID=A0ABQ5UER0_9HYPH|nr:ABC transporter permease [Devosia yakushimensis]GLQ09639.1 peptide ABC transporter permease [Devosia yakushimensis]
MTVHTFIDGDPETGPAVTPIKARRDNSQLAVAGQWNLIWHKFARNKLALASGMVIIIMALIGLFAEFLAPALPDTSKPQFTNAPPQQLRLFTTNEDGTSSFQPHVTGYTMEVDPASLRRSYVPDESVVVPVGFFVKGPAYKLWGLIPADRHLVGPLKSTDTMYLLGTDRLGRDLLSRLIHGTRISMSIGLLGVCISLCLGVTLGSLAGFYGGAVDALIARVIEVISSMPTIPLWLGLAAAIPLTWSPLTVYFVITLIVSLFGWTGLAREVRGRFYALRGEDFVTAAKLDGSTERRVIFRHILPSLTSHILAVVTLALPTMIVAETALSFLGIGLKAPIVSWGVLLQEAQNVRTIANAPWQLIWPAGAVVITVLAYNFLGDGMRDAADPYES